MLQLVTTKQQVSRPDPQTEVQTRVRIKYQYNMSLVAEELVILCQLRKILVTDISWGLEASPGLRT